ncbi:unnamed protein product [Phaeothamnion confervicola]
MWHSHTHRPDGVLQRGLLSLKPATSNNRRHCSACAVANSRRLPTPKMTRRVETASLEVVYVDLSGEIRPPGPRGEHNICTFTCGFTTYRWAYMIELESDAAKALALFVDEVKALGLGVRRLRSDSGGEFVGRAFAQACIDNGIKQEFTPPHTPEFMGKAERGRGVISGPTRALLAASNVEKRFGAEAFQRAVHGGTKALPPGQTPYALHGRPPSTADFRAFGAAAYVHLLPQQRPAGGKFTQRAVMGVMVCYSPNGAGWRIYVPAAGKVVTSGHVRFDEAVSPPTRLTGTRTDAGEDDVFPWPEEDDAATAAGGGGDVAVPNGPTIEDAATAEPTGVRAAVALAGACGGSGDKSGGEIGAASESGGGAGGRGGSGGSNMANDGNAGGAAADDPAGASAAGSSTQVSAADGGRGSGGGGNDSSSSGGSSGGGSAP